MNIREARRQAKTLYGHHAWVKKKEDGLCDILIGSNPRKWQGWPPQLSLGWGKTWEEAFCLAAKRMKHKHNNPERFLRWRKAVAERRD
jgi:hypothetical protein